MLPDKHSRVIVSHLSEIVIKQRSVVYQRLYHFVSHLDITDADFEKVGVSKLCSYSGGTQSICCLPTDPVVSPVNVRLGA